MVGGNEVKFNSKTRRDDNAELPKLGAKTQKRLPRLMISTDEGYFQKNEMTWRDSVINYLICQRVSRQNSRYRTNRRVGTDDPAGESATPADTGRVLSRETMYFNRSERR